MQTRPVQIEGSPKRSTLSYARRRSSVPAPKYLGKRFESLEEAQAYLDQWETKWADTRIHGTTKRQVAAMFAEEKPALLPLPLEPFRYYQFGDRTVHPDGCVEVEAAYYSAPPGWIGRSVKVQWDSIFVRILHPKTGQLMRERVRQKRGLHRIKARRPFFALAVWIIDSTRQSNYAVVSQDSAEESIQSGIIDIRCQYTFF